MAQLTENAETQTKRNKLTDKTIFGLYAALEVLAKSEDHSTSETSLKLIVDKFEYCFNHTSPERLRYLFKNRILQGKVTDRHKEIHPLQESPEDSEVNGDSLLFRAMIIQVEDSIAKNKLDEIKIIIIENCPEMIVFPKKEKKCKGITPLHVAILKEDEKLLESMKTAVGKGKIKQESIDSICAVGPVFQNTAMMAGTLLGVAALRFNKKIFQYVYLHFTKVLDGTNDKGDNIVHTLIKFAHIHPGKMNDALDMLRFIMNCDLVERKRDVRKLLMMRNKEKLNPLQLAAKRQQYDFFEFIQQHEVYCSKETNDGIYSEAMFDITEIETLALEPEVKAADEENIKKEQHESVLEYIVYHQTNNAFRFAAFQPVKEVIKEKWRYYRWLFWGWFILHFIFMTFLSIAALYRSKLSKSASKNNEVKYEYLVPKHVFVTAVSATGFVFAVLYFALELKRHCKPRFKFQISSNWLISRKRQFTTPYSNEIFRIYFYLFHVLLLIDSSVALAAGLGSAQEYHNYCLIFAVIIGWYLFMFFLQGFKPFSFFTVLIQRVILDMLKFAFVMLIFLLAFSIAMFMIMQGADTEDDDFNHFGKTMVKMLTIMLGIGELGILFQARQPILAIIVFVLFVLLTTILLLNALIALMSNSCTDLMSNNRGMVATKMHCRLQKLSVILFLESYLPLCCCKEVGYVKRKLRYENNEWVTNTQRRFWSLSSIHEDTNKEFENPTEPDSEQQNRFALHAILHKFIPERKDKIRKWKRKSARSISCTREPDL